MKKNISINNNNNSLLKVLDKITKKIPHTYYKYDNTTGEVIAVLTKSALVSRIHTDGEKLLAAVMNGDSTTAAHYYLVLESIADLFDDEDTWLALMTWACDNLTTVCGGDNDITIATRYIARKGLSREAVLNGLGWSYISSNDYNRLYMGVAV